MAKKIKVKAGGGKTKVNLAVSGKEFTSKTEEVELTKEVARAIHFGDIEEVVVVAKATKTGDKA